MTIILLESHGEFSLDGRFPVGRGSFINRRIRTIIALQEELRHVLRPRNIYEGSGQGGSDELISFFEVAEKC